MEECGIPMKRIEYRGNRVKDMCTQIKELFVKKPTTGMLAVIAAVLLTSLVAFSALAKQSQAVLDPDGSTATTTKAAGSVTRQSTYKSRTSQATRTTTTERMTTSTAAATTTTAVTVGAVVYKNASYGFRFSLPSDWKGYKVIEDKWQGYSIKNNKISENLLTGPEVVIRNPKWTEKNPWQDVPILVFTIAQWNAVLSGELQIGASPYQPIQLGLNSQYVFALPERYNYTDGEGIEEVEKILDEHPLQAIESK